MIDDKKITVKLMPDNKGEISQTSIEEREKHLNDALLDILNDKIKSAWAINLEEVNYLDKPVYKAYIYVIDPKDYDKIMGELLFFPEIIINKSYRIDYSERNIS